MIKLTMAHISTVFTEGSHLFRTTLRCLLIACFYFSFAALSEVTAQSNREWTPWQPCSTHEESPLLHLYFSKRILLFIEHSQFNYWEVKFKLDTAQLKYIKFVPGLQVKLEEQGIVRTYYLETLSLTTAQNEGLVKQIIKKQADGDQEVEVVVQLLEAY